MSLLNLRLSKDEDLLLFMPDFDVTYPRTDEKAWDRLHRLAAEEIERRLRARKVNNEPLELRRLGIRSKERLAPVAAAFALHFGYLSKNQIGSGGPESNFTAYMAETWLRKAVAMLEDETPALDYDENNSGTIDDSEKNRPFPTTFIRG
jgi:hypothetical protein